MSRLRVSHLGSVLPGGTFLAGRRRGCPFAARRSTIQILQVLLFKKGIGRSTRPPGTVYKCVPHVARVLKCVCNTRVGVCTCERCCIVHRSSLPRLGRCKPIAIFVAETCGSCLKQWVREGVHDTHTPNTLAPDRGGTRSRLGRPLPVETCGATVRS